MASLVTGLGGDAGFGEQFLAANDDGSTAAIDIRSVFGADGLNFYGTAYTTLFINNNGNITFEAPLASYTPFAITQSQTAIIAAYFADVETLGEPLEPTPGGTSEGTNLVWYDLDANAGVLTVTWDDVGYFNDRIDKRNAFQLQLIDQGGGDFDIRFNYEGIEWTTGDLDGGAGGLAGPNGIPARAGYAAGDGQNFGELAASGDEPALLDLPSSGDDGTGVYEFEVRNGAVAGDLDALDDAFAIREGRRLNGNLFADNGAGADEAGSGPLAVTAVFGNDTLVGREITLRSGAVLEVGEGGRFTYDVSGIRGLDAGEVFTESFTYTISNPVAGADTATVTITVRGRDDEGCIDLTAADDVARGTRSDDCVRGAAGDDAVSGRLGNDTLEGGLGADTLSGNGGDDRLNGDAGRDVLFGDAGDDRLFGSAGADTLTGGEGRDAATGGDGRDVFVLSPGDGLTLIEDFRRGEDLIGLETLLYEGLTITEAGIFATSEEDGGRDDLLARFMDGFDQTRLRRDDFVTDFADDFVSFF